MLINFEAKFLNFVDSCQRSLGVLLHKCEQLLTLFADLALTFHKVSPFPTVCGGGC